MTLVFCFCMYTAYLRKDLLLRIVGVTRRRTRDGRHTVTGGDDEL